MTVTNYIKLEFPSCSSNESFARAAAAGFAAQLDPTLDELGDIKTSVSEAVTNCIVHAYPDSIGTISMRLRILDGEKLEIVIRDKGRGIADLQHRRRGAQRYGLYHYGKLYGQAEGQKYAGQGHYGNDAENYPPAQRL